MKDITFLPAPVPPVRSKRAGRVAREFGIEPAARCAPSTNAFEGNLSSWLDSLIPQPGQVVLITGASGAGKSSLLRAVKNAVQFHREDRALRCIDLSRMTLPDRPVIDCFARCSLKRTLELLSRVGLAELWTYLRTPAELSEGQQWRLKLAISVARQQQRDRRRRKRDCDVTEILACDEFAAMLDRVSAAIVARTLRRAVTGSPHLCAVVATSHDDLVAALQPDRIIRCDFGRISFEPQINTDEHG